MNLLKLFQGHSHKTVPSTSAALEIRDTTVGRRPSVSSLIRLMGRDGFLDREEVAAVRMRAEEGDASGDRALHALAFAGERALARANPDSWVGPVGAVLSAIGFDAPAVASVPVTERELREAVAAEIFGTRNVLQTLRRLGAAWPVADSIYADKHAWEAFQVSHLSADFVEGRIPDPAGALEAFLRQNIGGTQSVYIPNFGHQWH